MAKVKKKEVLTLEKKLEHALVPIDEQPYEVPRNWCWVRFENIMHNCDYIRIPLSIKERSTLEKIYDYYGASGVIDKVDRYLFDGTRLLIGEDGANLLSRSTPIAFLATGKYWVNNHAHVLDSKSITTNEFVCNYINSIDLAPFVTGSAQPKLTQDKMNSIPVPIPPLAEQQRIVEKIESLFVKLDETKSKLEDIIEADELRRVAILHKAFSGELTEGWRYEKGISDSSGKKMTLGDVIKVSSGKSLTAKNMCEGDIPVYGGNGINGYHNESNIEEDTLVIGRVGFYCGVVHHILEPAWVTDNGLIVKSNKSKFDNRFLYYLLSYTDLRQNDSSTAQPVVSGSKIYPIEVSIPDMEEQIQVAMKIDDLLSLEESINNQIKNVINNIDLMKKSILAKAFRGELGTNNPEEESSVALLKEMLEKN